MTYDQAKEFVMVELELPAVGLEFVLIEGPKRFYYRVAEVRHQDHKIFCDRMHPVSGWQSWWSFGDWWVDSARGGSIQF